MKKTLFCIFTNRISLENAVDRLKIAGFRSSDLSLLMPNGGGDGFVQFIVGGTLGWLAGIGALSIPGVGPFIAAGPIMAALANTFNNVNHPIGCVLMSLGLQECEAKRLDGRITRGDILLAVHCDEEYGDQLYNATYRARTILEDTGAEDIFATKY